MTKIGFNRDADDGWYTASFSDFSNQLNYELLTRIAKTIPEKLNFSKLFFKYFK
jgi:hypothetical protein